MAQQSDKKIVLLYVYDILKDFSDENHLMTYADIIQKLDIVYNVHPEVKSVARNIETLMEYGLKIIRKGKTGIYLASRDFSHAEMTYLVDAVFSDKSIPSDSAKELIKKITKNCSTYERKKFKHIYKVDDISRTKDIKLFDTIELLDEAIERKKKISFQYNEYDISKNFLPRMQGRQFIMNPYFLVNNRGKYYLVCNYEKYNNLANYKIECISNVKILDEDIKPLETLDGCEKFSIQQYINEHIYMTLGESVKAKLRLDSEKNINDLIDWFGNQIEINKTTNGLIAELTVNEQALIYWALQYGKCVKVLSPESTQQKIITLLEQILNEYKS